MIISFIISGIFSSQLLVSVYAPSDFSSFNPKEDELVPEQKDYIVEKLNQFEDEVYNGILDSIDLESYSKYFLLEEFSGDPDNVFSSFYFTKERNVINFILDQFGILILALIMIED
jgi:hypothetical protein